jgi:protein phosphatase 2C family protein 2/3
MNLRKLSFRRSSKSSVTSDQETNKGKDPTMLRVGCCSIEGQSHGNEDRVFAIDDLRFIPNLPPMQISERIACATVFDGHGGDKCSDYLVRNLHIKTITNPRFESFANAGSVLLDSFKACEDEWNEIGERDEEFSGSCALACMVWGYDVVLAHAGDCRAVARVGKKTIQLTQDHRPSDPIEKARIIGAGGIIKGGRVMGVLAPSRGFGDLDVKRKAPSPDIIISEPEITTFRMDESTKGSQNFIVLAVSFCFKLMIKHQIYFLSN